MSKPVLFSNTLKVRMHDTDLAGVIYFAKQFRFAHDTWEEFLDTHGYNIHSLIRGEDYSFAVVHAEADFFSPLIAGDILRVDLSIPRVGESSFTTAYEIFKEEKRVGRVEIVFVCINQKSRVKQSIPKEFMVIIGS